MSQDTIALVAAVAGWAIVAIIVFVWIRREDKHGQQEKNCYDVAPGKNISFNVALPHVAVPATVVIEPIGQDSPDRGDHQVVEARIYLPATVRGDCCDRTLLEEIQFGDRVSIFGFSLSPRWGLCEHMDRSKLPPVGFFRHEFKYVAGKSCTLAFARAEKIARRDLGKLVVALLRRGAYMEDRTCGR